MSIQEVFTEINRKTVTILGLRGIANDKQERAKTESERGVRRMQVGLFLFLSLWGEDLRKAYSS